MGNELNRELHIIILYPNARHKEKEIIEDISKHLQIIECIDIQWSKHFENYSRFYRFKKREANKKLKECGLGNPLLITVMDNEPDYQFAEALVGYEYLNIKLLNLKFKYRDLIGVNAVHSTVNQKEAKRDLCLLLGVSVEDYLKTAPEQWNGEIRHIKRDLAGADGFKDLREMFYIINETMDYAVLRNFEMLPDDFRIAEHGDIDILVDNYNIALAMLNARPRSKGSAKAFNKVGNEIIPYDIRHLEDRYYHYDFAKDMLDSRIKNENGVYIFNDEYHFYSLLYHIFYQKYEIAEDYYDKVKDLFCKLKLNEEYNLEDYSSPFDLYFELLHDFMKKHDYKVIKPQYPVKYNKCTLNLGKEMKHFKEYYHVENIKPCNIPDYRINYKFFKGYIDNQHVFIKTGGTVKNCKAEFYTMKKLYDINNQNFVKPLFYCTRKDQDLVTEYIEGKNLKELIRNQQISDELKKTISTEFENIARSLIEANVVHRNIKPSNFILTKDNHIKLIDFRYALNNGKESSSIKENPDLLKKTKNKFSLGYLTWDDCYSMSKILDKIGIKNEFIEQNTGKYVVKFRQKYNLKTIMQLIFSVKNITWYNECDTVAKKYKLIRLFGLKIKIKRK